MVLVSRRKMNMLLAVVPSIFFYSAFPTNASQLRKTGEVAEAGADDFGDLKEHKEAFGESKKHKEWYDEWKKLDSDDFECPITFDVPDEPVTLICKKGDKIYRDSEQKARPKVFERAKIDELKHPRNHPTTNCLLADPPYEDAGPLWKYFARKYQEKSSLQELHQREPLANGVVVAIAPVANGQQQAVGAPNSGGLDIKWWVKCCFCLQLALRWEIDWKDIVLGYMLFMQ